MTLNKKTKHGDFHWPIGTSVHVQTVHIFYFKIIVKRNANAFPLNAVVDAPFRRHRRHEMISGKYLGNY